VQVHFDLEWQLGDPPIDLDPNLVALLDAIAAHGSLRAAARVVGLSCRHAWGLLRDGSARLGVPLANLTCKRGAVSTGAGERLRSTWHTTAGRLRANLDAAAEDAERVLRESFAPRSSRTLTIAASHSLALTRLRDLVASGFDLTLDLHSYGSLESLQRLHDGVCDLAGFHLPIGALGRRLLNAYRGVLDPLRQVLIAVVDREQGFLVRPGTEFTGLADLARGGLRFVNRQPGSGSRLAFDAMLADAGLSPEAVTGYANEEHTHLAVAALVASGAADAGLAERAAAGHLGLTFVPAFVERYFLALSRARLGNDAVQRLCAALRSAAFGAAVADLAGNDPAAAGTLHAVGDLARAGIDARHVHPL
jgi:molybdate transport repressor ModE-like protein